VATACLAHDIGNPPFGHAGESAIQEWFESSGAIDGLSGAERMTDTFAVDLYQRIRGISLP